MINQASSVSVSVSFISTPPRTKTSKDEVIVNIAEQQKKTKEEATKRFTLSHARNVEKGWWKELSMVVTHSFGTPY